MRIEAISEKDYQGAIQPDGSYKLYIKSGSQLHGPYLTDDLARITWETQVKKRQIGLVLNQNEIIGIISEQPLQFLMEEISFRLGLLREKLIKTTG